MNSERISLIGAPPSPYTRKMISLLRYRHINYEIIWGDPETILDSDEIFTKFKIEKPKPALLPTFILPNKDGKMEAVTDSTPILRRFEKEYLERSVIPDNPVLSFLNFYWKILEMSGLQNICFITDGILKRMLKTLLPCYPLIIMQAFLMSIGNNLVII